MGDRYEVFPWAWHGYIGLQCGIYIWYEFLEMDDVDSNGDRDRIIRILLVFVHSLALSAQAHVVGYKIATGSYNPSMEKKLGPFAKSAIDVFVICIALILRQCTEDIYCFSWISFVLGFHAFRQLHYDCWDYSFLDVFLVIFMEIVVLYPKDNVCVWVAKLTICFGVIYNRYWSYPKSITTTTAATNINTKAKGSNAKGYCGVSQLHQQLLIPD